MDLTKIFLKGFCHFSFARGCTSQNEIPSRAGVCFVFAFRALSERFQSAFKTLSVPFQGGGQKWAPTPTPERPTVSETEKVISITPIQKVTTIWGYD